MKHFISSKARLLAGHGFLKMAAAICTLSATCLAGVETKTESVPEKKTGGLSGVQLWSMHCSRCHPYRGANEFTAAHWGSILIHMRVRANLPADQAKAILQFLQESAGK